MHFTLVLLTVGVMLLTANSAAFESSSDSETVPDVQLLVGFCVVPEKAASDARHTIAPLPSTPASTATRAVGSSHPPTRPFLFLVFPAITPPAHPCRVGFLRRSSAVHRGTQGNRPHVLRGTFTPGAAFPLNRPAARTNETASPTAGAGERARVDTGERGAVRGSARRRARTVDATRGDRGDVRPARAHRPRHDRVHGG